MKRFILTLINAARCPVKHERKNVAAAAACAAMTQNYFHMEHLHSKGCRLQHLGNMFKLTCGYVFSLTFLHPLLTMARWYDCARKLYKLLPTYTTPAYFFSNYLSQ